MWAMQEVDIMPPALPGRPKGGSGGGSHNYGSEESWTWTVRQMCAEFQQLPPNVQEETRRRVLDLLIVEMRRGQCQPSALARLARKVYGIWL